MYQLRNNPLDYLNPVTLKSAFSSPVPVIASIPHSGLHIPIHLQKLYTPEHLARLRNTDWYLRELYDFLPSIGISVVQANFSRYTVDVNRSANSPLVGTYNRHAIYTHDTYGDPIIRPCVTDLSPQSRMNDFYRPFHRALRRAIDEMLVRHSKVYLIDLHSFGAGVDEDICLGSKKHNRTAPMSQPIFKKAIATTTDFTVACNGPYSGGFITQHYSGIDGVEALQIELNYRTYLKTGSFEAADRLPEIDVFKFEKARFQLKRALVNATNALKI